MWRTRNNTCNLNNVVNHMTYSNIIVARIFDEYDRFLPPISGQVILLKEKKAMHDDETKGIRPKLH